MSAAPPLFGGRPRPELTATDDPGIYTDGRGGLYMSDEAAAADRQDQRDDPAPARRKAPQASRLAITRASDVRVERLQFLLPGRVPLGALTLLAGDPGLGKSSWTCLLAAEVTSGRRGPAGTVLMANAEDSAAHVLVPRLAAAGADLELVEFFAALDPTSDAGERPFTLPADVAALEDHARGADARLVVVDPLNAHLADDVPTKSDHGVRRALAPLAAMAQRLAIAVVVVAHLNKGAGMDPIYRVGGSIGLVGGARSLLVFTRDPEDPVGDQGDRRALGHVKSNWAKLERTLVYSHETTSVTVGGTTVETNRLMSVGESDTAGAALLAPADADSPRSQLERAEELLADVLGDGERHRAKELKEVARRQGIPERTLQRAAAEAGVLIESEGFPRVTFWSLDSGASATGATVAPTLWRDSETPDGNGESGTATGAVASHASNGVTDGDGGTVIAFPGATGDDEGAA